MKADTGTQAKRCGVGIALRDAAAGDTVDVCIGGMAEAKVKAGTGVGESLSIFNTTAGVLEPYQNTFEDPILAIAGAAEAGGKAIVFVIKQILI